MNKDNENLVKSYRLLTVWLLSLFILAGIFSVLLIRLDLNLSSKVTTLFWLCFVSFYFISLLLMIYKTERVYYINYITHKEAQQATKEERRAFAYKHLIVFCIATFIFVIYSIVSLIFQYPAAVDFAVFIVIIIVSALRTVPFKLKE
ncbi:hypothetical protein [Alkaliphilus peptidifermentans]|uniref:DUF2178 domain-containing protein n=1 Tax=Alkaliphilus peptidifermentans DSM 18978 TaxID=1120976 RepID=A0A1G5GY37_9FIRM|nr:hypothetical protein [Alkaliphilus peptidifermentans]SCY56060.1 hypothetical protein SAMN03080606_01814 [Alkaliphilus peptidifermentans DSM 18978]